MEKFSEQEIKAIVQKASLLQKFSRSSSSTTIENTDDRLSHLYEITDELDIERSFVQEAFLESNGISTREPILVDNNDFNSIEVTSLASGKIDQDLLNELKAKIEYHFNTQGKVYNRPGKLEWKAAPEGLSKFIASVKSPEVTFNQVESHTQITVKQSLKTVNKLFAPALASGFGAFMLFAAAIILQNNDSAPMLIASAAIFFATFIWVKFVNSRKKKKKKNLSDLADILQQTIQRRFKASAFAGDNPAIKISEQQKAQPDYKEVSIKSGIKNR